MTPRQPVRIGIVGSGNIAHGQHLPVIRSLRDRARVVAAMDVDIERARKLAEEWDIPAVYAELDAMLSAASPDLVIVCTPPVAHHDAVIECLAAGSWVWCEKPPTLSLAEYDDIARHEQPGGPYVSYVFQHRFGSGAQRLRQQIAAGTLGRPLVAVCNTLWYRPHAYFDAPWRGRWATEGGGPTMGHGIHQIDLALYLLGDWTEVVAAMGTLDREVETEDVSMAAALLHNGAMMSVVNSLLSPRETSYLRFDFTSATVELTHTYGYDNSNWSWTPVANLDPAVAEGWPPTQNVRSGHAAQLSALIEAFHAGDRPPASGADGRRSLEFISGLYKSAITRQPVRRDSLIPDDPFYHALNGETGTTAAEGR